MAGCALVLESIDGRSAEPGGRVRIDLGSGDGTDDVPVVFVAVDGCRFSPEELGAFVIVGEQPEYVEVATDVSADGTKAIATLQIDRRDDAVPDEAIEIAIDAPEATVVIDPQPITLDLQEHAGMELVLGIAAVVAFGLAVVVAAIRTARRTRQRVNSG